MSFFVALVVSMLFVCLFVFIPANSYFSITRLTCQRVTTVANAP